MKIERIGFLSDMDKKFENGQLMVDVLPKRFDNTMNPPDKLGRMNREERREQKWLNMLATADKYGIKFKTREQRKMELRALIEKGE